MKLQLTPFPASAYAAWREEQVERRREWQFGPLCGEVRGGILARLAVDELAPAEGLSGTYLERVLGGEDVVGWLWLSRANGDLIVLDADVAAPAADLLALLECHARAGKSTTLVLDLMVQAPTMSALSALGGYETTSQTLLSRLDDGITGHEEEGPPVLLRPMTSDSYHAYRRIAIEGMVGEMCRSEGLSEGQALPRAQAELAARLPDGLHTERQTLFDVIEAANGARVGALWLEHRPPLAAFICDLHLIPVARGRGLGRSAMRAVAAWCHSRGVGRLGLSILGSNEAACGLAISLGYDVVVKSLRRPVAPVVAVAGPR
ncbi:MAG: GNAT family N-acetyltransferase [Promicromonosporaceae bacterium]|nr:GNAT family N-acetyltransferase [Promicromonosporaceae bacterium]